MVAAAARRLRVRPQVVPRLEADAVAALQSPVRLPAQQALVGLTLPRVAAVVVAVVVARFLPEASSLPRRLRTPRRLLMPPLVLQRVAAAARRAVVLRPVAAAERAEAD